MEFIDFLKIEKVDKKRFYASMDVVEKKLKKINGVLDNIFYDFLKKFNSFARNVSNLFDNDMTDSIYEDFSKEEIIDFYINFSDFYLTSNCLMMSSSKLNHQTFEDFLDNFLVLKFSEIGGEKFLNEIFKILNNFDNVFENFTKKITDKRSKNKIKSFIEDELKFIYGGDKTFKFSLKDYKISKEAKFGVISDFLGNEYKISELNPVELAEIIFRNTSIFASNKVLKNSKVGIGKISDITHIDSDENLTFGVITFDFVYVLLKINGKEMAPFSSKNSSVYISFNEDNMKLNDIDDFDFDNFYDGIQVIFNETGFEQWTEKMKNEFYKKLNEFACSIEYWVGG